MGESVANLISLPQGLEGIDSEDVELALSFAAVWKDPNLVPLGRLERSPGKNDNWIESVGKLPAYIEEVANSLHTKQGMPISRAIATAISQIKKWAATGSAEVKAKAAKAISEWEALRAKAAAKRASK